VALFRRRSNGIYRVRNWKTVRAAHPDTSIHLGTTMKLQARPLFFAWLLTTLTVAGASAQSGYDSEAYPFDHAQGGWVDEEAGLVWGYNAVCVTDVSNWDHISAELFAGNYPVELQNFGENNEGWGDAALADGDAALAAGNLEEADFFYALSDDYYEKAAALYLAADVADDYEGWRLASLEELQAAHTKGLFSFPRNPTLDPDNCDPYFFVWRATSTYRGKNSAYRFLPTDGSSEVVSLSTIGNVPIVVRSLNPNAGGGGGGNGKGKNK
jgi:hypothetical protein